MGFFKKLFSVRGLLRLLNIDPDEPSEKIMRTLVELLIDAQGEIAALRQEFVELKRKVEGE